MEFGRKQLFTDEKFIDGKNIISIVQNAFIDNMANVADIQYLLNYEAGEQPLVREKTYRKDIDIQCVDNIANEITEFNLGYKWGNPITLVQRGEKNLLEGISELNSCYDAENISAKTQQLGRYVEITGIGFTYVDINDEWKDGDSYFDVEVLNPEFTFVIRSSYYLDRRVMVGVTYRTDDAGNNYFTCFTKNARYEIKNLLEVVNGEPARDVNGEIKSKWILGERSGEKNPLGEVPIIEWIRDYDRMGCFERQISEMDNLNVLVSDFTNDVDQNTQAIWHGNDIEFPVDEDGNEVKPNSNDWLLTYTTDSGKTPFINALAVQYDYGGMLNNIISRRALILQKCNVPQRNSTSGGSSGIAMADASGWSSAETSAVKQDGIKEMCKMEELRIALMAIKNSPFVEASNPMLELKPIDIVPSIKRSKTYELTVKVNGLTTLLAHGFALEDALSVAPLFEDNNQVCLRSGEGVKKYQESSVFSTETIVDEARPFPDISDEENNTPNVDGMSTGSDN